MPSCLQQRQKATKCRQRYRSVDCNRYDSGEVAFEFNGGNDSVVDGDRTVNAVSNQAAVFNLLRFRELISSPTSLRVELDFVTSSLSRVSRAVVRRVAGGRRSSNLQFHLAS